MLTTSTGPLLLQALVQHLMQFLSGHYRFFLQATHKVVRSKRLTSALAYMQNTGDCSCITAALVTEQMLIHHLYLMPHVMCFIISGSCTYGTKPQCIRHS